MVHCSCCGYKRLSKSRVRVGSRKSIKSNKRSKRSMLRKPTKCMRLTLSMEMEYFWGRAGLIRLLIMFLGTGSFMLGTAGFVSRIKGVMTYGDTPLTIAAMVLNFIAVLIVAVFLILLLLFREVRVDDHWEEINMKAHVVGCILSIAASFCEILAMHAVRHALCPDCKTAIYKENEVTLLDLHELPEYWKEHYLSFATKLASAMLFSFAAGVFVKNKSDFSM